MTAPVAISRRALLERLLDPERVAIFDGAMGTMLYAKGVFINQCYDELNVRAPDLVRGVHEEYARAGAEVLETNSFGANRPKLAQYGLEGEVRAFNAAAALWPDESRGGAELFPRADGSAGRGWRGSLYRRDIRRSR
jgi:methionine synthase / methylenetetrahydrofolate reductase(NADPH)